MPIGEVQDIFLMKMGLTSSPGYLYPVNSQLCQQFCWGKMVYYVVKAHNLTQTQKSQKNFKYNDRDLFYTCTVLIITQSPSYLFYLLC